MTIELIPFAFDDHLVRAVWRDGEPWFVGKDVCACLGLERPENALGSLNEDERYTLTKGIPDGRVGPDVRVLISEPGAYRLVFRSRKPEAERFKRWLAHEVLPQIRKTGRYGAPGDDGPVDSLVQRLTVVRECRMLFGAERARSLWRKLGLPDVPPPPNGPLSEAWACLRHLLEAKVDGADGLTMQQVLALALDDDENARALLVPYGVKVLAERDAFAVANTHPGVARLFADTAWDGPLGHVRVLRRLPGVEGAGTHRYGKQSMRGTEIPGSLLDHV